MENLFDVFVDLMQSWKSGQRCNVNSLINNLLRYECHYEPGQQRKILIIGSGGLSIGQAGEFDYSGAQVNNLLN